MRLVLLIGFLMLLVGCSKDELSSLSIVNRTGIPIYALPYTSDYAEGDWIIPGGSDEFFSIEHGNLDGFDYFSFYYDSLVIYIEDREEFPLKFYKDGRTVNYDSDMNPFTNRDMWVSHQLSKSVPGNGLESVEDKEVLEHFFSIRALNIPFIADTLQSN